VFRAGTGRLFYSTRLQYSPLEPLDAADRGIRIERRYERFVEAGESPAATTFNAGDLIRVTLTLVLPQERRYVAVSDPLVGGVEAVDSWFRTTASDLARDASVTQREDASDFWFSRGGFDHVEKYDDRVTLFATRLAEGRHQFSYLVRATTAGTFRAAGASAEEMYAPEVQGRTAPVTIVVR
jgi:alpha-2-macroglobulin